VILFDNLLIYFLFLNTYRRDNDVYTFFLKKIWFWIDIFLYFFIPFVTMAISFILILIKLHQSNQTYLSYVTNKNIWIKRIRKNRQILVKLFIVNAYFFFSYLPYHIYNFLIENSSEQNYYLFTFFNILFYSNNAMNFFFYGVSSHSYRKTLRKYFQPN